MRREGVVRWQHCLVPDRPFLEQSNYAGRGAEGEASVILMVSQLLLAPAALPKRCELTPI